MSERPEENGAVEIRDTRIDCERSIMRQRETDLKMREINRGVEKGMHTEREKDEDKEKNETKRKSG